MNFKLYFCCYSAKSKRFFAPLIFYWFQLNILKAWFGIFGRSKKYTSEYKAHMTKLREECPLENYSNHYERDRDIRNKMSKWRYQNDPLRKVTGKISAELRPELCRYQNDPLRKVTGKYHIRLYHRRGFLRAQEYLREREVDGNLLRYYDE